MPVKRIVVVNIIVVSLVVYFRKAIFLSLGKCTMKMSQIINFLMTEIVENSTVKIRNSFNIIFFAIINLTVVSSTRNIEFFFLFKFYFNFV